MQRKETTKTVKHSVHELSAVCELLGTCLFAYMVVVSNAKTITDSLGMFALLLIFGGVTKGHFNPATTIGVYFYEG